MADREQEKNIFTIVSDDGDMGPEEKGRHVFVCIGDFGKRVLDRMTTCMGRLEQRWPFLTQFVDLGQDVLPDWDLPDKANRNQVRQAFIRRDNIEFAFTAFANAISESARMPEIGSSNSRIDPTINIHIVADLSDLFSSAVLLDVASLLGLAARNHRYFVSGVFGAAVFPEEIKLRIEALHPEKYAHFSFREALVCAALREVDMCRRFGLGSEFDYPDLFHYNRKRSPFDHCHVLLNKNMQGEISEPSVQARLIARYLLRFSWAGFGADVFEQSSNQPLYSSLGLSSFYFPRAQLYFHCLLKWTEDVVLQFIKKPDKATGVYERNTPIVGQKNSSLLDIENHRVYQCLNPLLPPCPSFPSSCVPVARNDLVEAFLALGNPISEYIKGMDAKLDSKHVDQLLNEQFVEPEKKRIQELTDQMVTGSPGGAVSMAALLRRDLDALEKLVADTEFACEEKKRHADNSRESLFMSLRSQTDSSEKVPSDLSLIIWPFKIPGARRLREELEKHRAEWSRKIEIYLNLYEEAFYLGGKARALRRISEILQGELKIIKDFLERLEQVSEHIFLKYQKNVPSACTVDLSALEEKDYNLIYDHYVKLGLKDTSDQAASSLLPWREIAGCFRAGTVIEFAKQIERKGECLFKGIADLNLGSIQSIPFLKTEKGWMESLTEQAWEYATPLIGETLPESRAEICALKVPEKPFNVTMAPDGKLYGVPATVLVGGTISVRFCRALYGFPFSEMRFLAQYAHSYGIHLADPGLHIMDGKDKFPLMPVE